MFDKYGTVPVSSETCIEFCRSLCSIHILSRSINYLLQPVLGIRIRMFLGLQDPDPDALAKGPDPVPSLLWNNACKIFAKNNLRLKIMCLRVSFKEKIMEKHIFLHPLSHWRKESDPDTLVRGTDAWIRIRPKMSRIANTLQLKNKIGKNS